jgi:hypothetical protein
MGLKITNNAFGTLAASINDSVTSITVASGQGSRFPTLGAGDYFYATLINISNEFEIVKCTARTGDVLTVTRAQDGTTARAYTVGDRLEIRPVAAIFDEKADVTYVDSEISTLDAAKLDDVAPGTSGNVLTSNGTAWVSQALPTPPASGFSNIQIFTASGTFTTPAGVTKAKVTVVGGGGGGNNGTSNLSGSTAGAGGVAIAIINNPSSSYTVTIGAGGGVGGTGGTSSFGTALSATGGLGGAVSANQVTGSGSVTTGTTIRATPSQASAGPIGYISLLGVAGGVNSGKSAIGAAVAYSTTGPWAAGVGGFGGLSTNGCGGVGGVVVVEY